MLSELALPIICKKYNISCILFDRDYKIVEFSDNLSCFASDISTIKIGHDVRDSFWEFVGFEEKLDDLYDEKRDYVHVPMLSQRDTFYDINIETCFIKPTQKLYIAMFTRQSKFSMGYLNMIQKINHETLHYENQKESMKINERYYNLINQKLISFHINSSGIITEVNKACSSFFGFEQSDMLGHHFSDFFFSREASDSNSTHISSILRAVDVNGVDVFFHTDIIPVSSDNKSCENIIICQDITYLKRIESELEFAVHHDSLTGLPNRTMLRKKLEECIVNSKKNGNSFALCFIDLDKFKYINDNYGHHAGDMLLKHVGEVLSSVIREGDLIARIGGDEFVVLFEYLEPSDYLESTLKRIEQISMESPLYYNENLEIPLNFSLGLSVYPKDGRDIEELLSYADKQMYLKKKSRS